MIDRLVRTFARREVMPPIRVPPRVSVRRSRLVAALGGRLAGMGRHAAAVTLGRTIVMHPDATPTARLVRHELAHVRQWERHPVTFPLRYIWNHLRFGYRANPYEVEAREAESPHLGGQDDGR